MHDSEIRGRIIYTFTRHISYNYTLIHSDTMVTFSDRAVIKLLFIYILLTRGVIISHWNVRIELGNDNCLSFDSLVIREVKVSMMN